MDERQIVGWLKETDPARLEKLWAKADAVRRAHVGDDVHLRALIEVSSHCVCSGGRAGFFGLLGHQLGARGARAAVRMRRRFWHRARRAQRAGKH
jgi:hypothetical protein